MGEIRNCEPRADAKYEDHIERVSPTLYVRFTSGPDYEHAFLCVDDGEPDMRDVAEMSFGQARLFIAAYTAGINASVSADEVVEWGETTAAMQLLRGPLSKRATSAEFNEWQARDIVKYIDDLRSALAASPPDAGVVTDEMVEAGFLAGNAEFLRQYDHPVRGSPDELTSADRAIMRAALEAAEAALATSPDASELREALEEIRQRNENSLRLAKSRTGRDKAKAALRVLDEIDAALKGSD